MTPKFEVGEVVILQSVNWPQHNGEYSVEVVLHDGDVYTDPYYGGEYEIKDGDGHVSYILNSGAMKKLSKLGKTVSIRWDECALRKKHQPGALSFRDLMQTLKDPSKCQNA